MLRYSEQTEVLLSGMKDFDRVAFEKWFNENLSVGSNNIIEYLLFKKKIAQEKKRLEEIENGI